MGDVLRGVLFSLGGNIAISIGDHLKVFGDIDRRRRGKKLHHAKTLSPNRVRQHRSVLFGFMGYVVMIAGQISNGYALAYAPQTLLACIGSIQFIMNLVCSAILMGRPIKFVHIIGTLSIISGCLLMIFGFRPKTDQSKLTVYTLFYNFNSVHYRNYLMVVVIVFTASIVWQWFESKFLVHSAFATRSSKPSSKQRLKASASSNPTRSSSAPCCPWKLISGFFYSFSSAMTGTQSVVLGKTLAIIIRNYAAGKIVIFDPLDLFILMFVIVVFFSFLVTFAFWLYRRTESMVLFDTVFIAPLNQVMWLTFSTVAGGIYFREFENASTLQWVALISGMMLNYLGLYNLVPTRADHPVLVINMEKPLKRKQKMDDSTETFSFSMKIKKSPGSISSEQWKRQQKYKQSDDLEYPSDSISKSYSRRQRRPQTPRTANGNEQWIPMEILPPDDSDVTDDEMEESVAGTLIRSNTNGHGHGNDNGHGGDTETDDEGQPLLMNNVPSAAHRARPKSSSHSISTNAGSLSGKFYDLFAAKRR